MSKKRHRARHIENRWWYPIAWIAGWCAVLVLATIIGIWLAYIMIFWAAGAESL